MNKTKVALTGVQKIVLVVSGKGGVGKSTIAANLALSLQKQGLSIGLLDADIYGPSIPKIFNIQNKPTVINNQFMPLIRHGLKLMSMGFLSPENSAIIWRGPMTTKVLHKLFRMTKWSPIDYLIVDTPPGTGDVHLSIVENYQVDNAIVVSTPQTLAILDAFKTVDMLRKLNINIAGMIENMAFFNDQKGGKEHIFGESNLLGTCNDRNITYLGQISVLQKVAVDYLIPEDDEFCRQTLQQAMDRLDMKPMSHNTQTHSNDYKKYNK